MADTTPAADASSGERTDTAKLNAKDVADRLDGIHEDTIATAENLWTSVFTGLGRLAADLDAERVAIKQAWTGPAADAYTANVGRLVDELNALAKQNTSDAYKSFWGMLDRVRQAVTDAKTAYNNGVSAYNAYEKSQPRPHAPAPQQTNTGFGAKAKSDAQDFDLHPGNAPATDYVGILKQLLDTYYEETQNFIPPKPAPPPDAAAPGGTPDLSKVPGLGPTQLGAGIGVPSAGAVDKFGQAPGIHPFSGPGIGVPPLGGVATGGGAGSGVPLLGGPKAGGPAIPPLPAVDYTGIDPKTGLPFGLDPRTKLADFQPGSGGSGAFGGGAGLPALGVPGSVLPGPAGGPGSVPGPGSGSPDPRSATVGSGAAGYAGGMGAPLGGMGAGGGRDGEQRQRQSWLPEDQDIWGADPDLPPSVIGRG